LTALFVPASEPLPKLILVAIEGWSENGAEWNYALLRKELENIPGVKVVVPNYLDAKGIFSKFQSHKTVEEYAAIVEDFILKLKAAYPNVPIWVLGHSLGGLIARFLYQKGLFPEENMVLAGTPNLGIDFGIVLNAIINFLAKRFNVPLIFQLMRGSGFLWKLNVEGIPKKAWYISGQKDMVVPEWSSNPLGIGYSVAGCGHKLFPRELEKLEASAIPVVKRIIGKGLDQIKTASLTNK
jgi:hypothetical protein